MPKPHKKDSNTKQTYIDKPFNIRPLCFLAVLVVSVVALCMWHVAAAAVFLVLTFACLFAFQFLKSHDKVLNFFGASRAFLLLSVTVCIIIMLSFSIYKLSYTYAREYYGVHTLAGAVENYRVRDTEAGSSQVTISGVVFNDEKLSGRVTIYLDVRDGLEHDLEIGSKIIVDTVIKKARFDDFYVNNRVKYTANARIGDIQITGVSLAPRHSFVRYSADFFSKFMSTKNVNLVISLLFGDKSSLDDEVNADFSVSGLSHALSVSGLHVSVIIGMFLGFLKLLRIRSAKRQFPIIAVILLFYCYLCDFRFSIIRACIMFLIILFNRMFLRRADALSSLCFAGITTLLIFPMSIQSVSLQLSYACMFGIILFLNPIKNFFEKFVPDKLPTIVRRFVDFLIITVSMYLCVNIASFPLVIKYFSYLPIYGFISNLLFLPILVVALQCALLSFITWIFGFLMYPINYLLDFVRLGTNWVASLPLSYVPATNDGYFFLLYYLGLILVSRFIFIRGRYKYAFAATAFCIYFLGFFV